ncbi:MAG: hypothetical protein WC917_00195 [Bacilli bacterium]|jgi:hypothetical protein
MKAKELIKFLSKLPEDTLVMTRGYEGGYCDAMPFKGTIKMLLDVHEEWYYGPHELAEDVDNKEDYKEAEVVVI